MAAYLVSLFLLNALLDIQVNGIGAMGWGVQWWWTIGTWPEEGFAWINIALVLNFGFFRMFEQSIQQKLGSLCVSYLPLYSLSMYFVVFSLCVIKDRGV